MAFLMNRPNKKHYSAILALSFLSLQCIFVLLTTNVKKFVWQIKINLLNVSWIDQVCKRFSDKNLEGQISDKALVSWLLTSDPSDHPYNHWVWWQDPTDMDGTAVISRFCSSGDLLLRPASCEPNTLQHHDWSHRCPRTSLKLMLSGAGTML